ncbi:MAG: hypothetical protein Q4P05_07945, partial [Actinomycetaceae bacterium]|nr:hypothetical protein [Actinomycetaceae bacterium]
MRRFTTYVGGLLAATLAIVLPAGSALAVGLGNNEDTVTVQVAGHPAAYCDIPVPEGERFSPITTIEVPSDATFGQIKDQLPEPVSTLGYVFDGYFKSG